MPQDQISTKDTSIENMAVGHAGLYVPTEDDDIDTAATKIANTLGAIAQTLVNDIPLGIDKGGKTLLDTEQGIKAFVKDELAGKQNHLPDTEVGIWVHYLTKGIERDFGRTWEKDPKSIAPKKSKEEKKAESGGRLLTKKQKNMLVAKRRWDYWEKLIDEGKVTEEEAEEGMKGAIAEVKRLKEMGLYINTNKTKGVQQFDWEREITEMWDGDESKLNIYKKHKLLPLVPVLEKKWHMHSTNKFVTREWNKTIIKTDDSKSIDKKFISSKIDEWENLTSHYTPKTFSICKIEVAGKMKERWFVCDAIRKSDKKQVLLMWDSNGKDGILE
jgi:hypothetical protein